MRIVRRILITTAITFVVLFVGAYWVAPIALSFYAAKKAPAIARVVPSELKDKSVSQAPGTKLSYVGYEFEVPWTDLDETQTKLYPNDKPEKTKVDLHFRSGLRLLVTACPPREFEKTFTEEVSHLAPRNFEAYFGKTDYDFLKKVYEFSPDKMNHWSLSPTVQGRESLLLIIKSIVPSNSAVDGIFNVGNKDYKGFQQGDPQIRQYAVHIELLSEDGGVEFMLLQMDYKAPSSVTQPELNRIVQSLRRAPRTG